MGDESAVLEFRLTIEQWLRFERAMELCERLTGTPATPEKCLELICRNYLARRGIEVPHESRDSEP